MTADVVWAISGYVHSEHTMADSFKSFFKLQWHQVKVAPGLLRFNTLPPQLNVQVGLIYDCPHCMHFIARIQRLHTSYNITTENTLFNRLNNDATIASWMRCLHVQVYSACVIHVTCDRTQFCKISRVHA